MNFTEYCILINETMEELCLFYDYYIFTTYLYLNAKRTYLWHLSLTVEARCIN